MTRPWVPDTGYFIYWNWLPDSFHELLELCQSRGQALAISSHYHGHRLAERQAKLRRFQEIVNGDIGLVPSLRNLTTSLCANMSRAMSIILMRSRCSPS
jgi:hypothetical protein